MAETGTGPADGVSVFSPAEMAAADVAADRGLTVSVGDIHAMVSAAAPLIAAEAAEKEGYAGHSQPLADAETAWAKLVGELGVPVRADDAGALYRAATQIMAEYRAEIARLRAQLLDGSP